jgi:hypothetical protein|tara:strand:+ start:645 stop:1022 length:378 start_codon:yes stop_codon:yes gene_type:complete
MLKSIQSNNSPGHTHNGQTSVVDLSTDFCPGNHLTKSNKMRNIGDTFHFKGYVWEIEDKWKGGYALGRTTKNNKYELNGWVTENYQIFDNNPNKPEQIKRPRFRVCNKCGNSWERVHYCKSKEDK